MSYCPEDGVVMEEVHMGADNVCYRCPTCQSHIVYAPEWIGAAGYVFMEQECEFCGWREEVKEQGPEAGGLVLELDGPVIPDDPKLRAEQQALEEAAKRGEALYGPVEEDD